MPSFFSEVCPELQRAFASANGIDGKTLVAAAKAFSVWSGQAYEIAAQALRNASNWQALLAIARGLINQGNAKTNVIDRWTLGGRTVLMFQIGHRESYDIDIFFR